MQQPETHTQHTLTVCVFSWLWHMPICVVLYNSLWIVVNLVLQKGAELMTVVNVGDTRYIFLIYLFFPKCYHKLFKYEKKGSVRSLPAGPMTKYDRPVKLWSTGHVGHRGTTVTLNTSLIRDKLTWEMLNHSALLLCMVVLCVYPWLCLPVLKHDTRLNHTPWASLVNCNSHMCMYVQQHKLQKCETNCFALLFAFAQLNWGPIISFSFGRKVFLHHCHQVQAFVEIVGNCYVSLNYSVV